MHESEVKAMLEKAGALLEGHFQLTSGLHSDRYVQCALALSIPATAEALGRGLAEAFEGCGATVVAGPALGGIVIAHEVASALGVRCVFCEREKGKMALRRGFSLSREDRVLAVEDVVTTGGSVMELADLTEAQGAKVVGVGSIVDRRADKSSGPRELRSLLKLDLTTWEPGICPLCSKGSMAVKPGSRPT